MATKPNKRNFKTESFKGLTKGEDKFDLTSLNDMKKSGFKAAKKLKLTVERR